MPARKRISSDRALAKNLFPHLSESEAAVLFHLFRDSSLSDAKLREILGFRSATSVAHYRKLLESKGIIKRYALDVDWEKLGYKTKFLILCEAEDKETLHQIAKEHVIATNEYVKRVGDMFIIPTPFGDIMLYEVSTVVSENGIIYGLAASEDAAKSYSDIYLKERYPKMKQTLFLIRDVSIKGGLADMEFINKYLRMVKITQQDKESLKDFIKRFPWKRFKA